MVFFDNENPSGKIIRWVFNIDKMEIKKSGAIILSQDLKSVALVFRPQKNDWSFPKGHIEDGEDFLQTMKREVSEELGIKIFNLSCLPDMKYANTEGEAVCLKMGLGVFCCLDENGKHGKEEMHWIKTEDVIDKLSYENLKEYFSSVLPVIKKIKPIFNGMTIIVSQKENFINGAQIIKDNFEKSGFHCEIVFIEDIVLGTNNQVISGTRIIYFLTNSGIISQYCEHFDSLGHYIISRECITGDNSKFYLQDKLKESEISVPKSMAVLDHYSALDLAIKMKFPFYIKSQKQASIVRKVSNENELLEVLHLFRDVNEEYYFEEVIRSEENDLRKIYYINGICILNNEENDKYSKIFKLVANVLHLDAFSVDIFFGKDEKYWIIDVNPAPAFFKSHEARHTFVEFCIRKIYGIE